MKKGVRILLTLIAFGLVVSWVAILLDEILNKGLWEMVQEGSRFWILTGATFLGILSLSFNAKKFEDQPIRRKYYRVIRFGDMIFSLYVFAANVLVLGDLISIYINRLSSGFQTKLPLESMALYIALVLFSIVLFIDNLKFHKFLVQYKPKESIDDIGKI